MTITEKIELIKPKINYDFNQNVKDTLFPFDYFVKRAYEDALRQVGKKYAIVQKSVFIPLVKNIRDYSVDLSILSKDNFEIVSPKSLTVFNSDNGVVGISEALLKDILRNNFQDVFKVAYKLLGMNLQIRTSVNVDSATNIGKFDKITVVSGSDINILTFANATLGYYVVNLDKADKGIYDYRTISALSTPTVTLSSNVSTSNPAWTVNEKIYISESLPLMMLYTFNGIPKLNYFDTESIIPIQEQYLDDLDDIAVAYLFNILSSRYPEQSDVYAKKLNSGLLKPVHSILTDIGIRVNNRMDNKDVDLYSPYQNYYGR